MSDKKVIKIALFVLLIISLLTVGASAGWSQGFIAGSMVTGSAGGVIIPSDVTTPHIGYSHSMGFTPFLLLGACLKFGFFLFFFMCIGKMFRFWGMKRHGWQQHMHEWHKGHKAWKHHAHHPACFHPHGHDRHPVQDTDEHSSHDTEDPLDDTIRYA